MQEFQRKTLWNTESNKRSMFPPIALDLTDDLQTEMEQFVREISQEDIRERIEPYETAVTDEILRYTVK